MKGYLQALVRETLAVGVFLFGLVSTAITFLPALGGPVFPPLVVRTIGSVVMIVAFVLANYKLYVKQQARIDALQSDNQRLVPQNRDDDVDTLRNLLLRLWRLNPAPIGRHITSEIVAHELGWDLERLNAAAMRAAGNFGTLQIAFDGRTFLLQGIPI
jgi:hypothetical protein